MKTEKLHAKICSITNKGMSEGFILGGDEIKDEKNLLKELRKLINIFNDDIKGDYSAYEGEDALEEGLIPLSVTDEALIEFSYDNEYHYYTEWYDEQEKEDDGIAYDDEGNEYTFEDKKWVKTVVYQLLSNDLLMGDDETPSKLYVEWDNKGVRYITTDKNNTNHQYFKSTKHPQNLTEEERHRVLTSTLSKFDKDEIVNYNDLFLQGEFIEEMNIPNNYTLSENWVNY